MTSQSIDCDLIQHKKNLEALVAVARLFNGYREKIAQDYPDWMTSKDTRHEIFARCNTVFNCTVLLFISRLEYLSRPVFWDTCEPKISDYEKYKIITSCDRHIRFSLIHGICSVIESSLRIITQSIDADEYSKRRNIFHNIYTWLFEKAGISDQSEIINLFSLIRNTIHNNSVYYHYSESDKVITWKGKTYTFTIGQQLNFLSWMDICPLLTDLGNTLNKLITSGLISSLQSTPEIIGLTKKQ